MADEEKEESTKDRRSAVDYDDLADKLRTRMDLFGKSIAAIATLGTGAVGLATVGDLAPRGGSSWFAALVAILGLLLAAWGAVRVAAALIQVNQPVVLEPDDNMLDLEAAETSDVARIYADSAQRFGMSSLVGLQDRESALRLAAAQSETDEGRVRRTELASEASDEIQHALARARWALVRRRSSEAASGNSAKKSYLMVAGGLLAFALLSDVATANQTDNIDIAKACGDARKAGAIDGDLLKTLCHIPEKEPGQKDKEQTPKDVPKDAALAQVASQLVDVLQACYALADPESKKDPARPLDLTDCDTVKGALSDVLGTLQDAEEDGASG